jgi:glycosyltransferase involved in cell wall biosynthesis
MLTSELLSTRQLWNLDGPEIVDRYAAQTAAIFTQAAEQNATPVVLPVCNEEADLPATLVALSRSRLPVRPIVVSNGSTDQTVSIAGAMGASVEELSRPDRTSATHRGVCCALGRGATSILFTDGDTLVGPRWAETMVQSVAAANEQNSRKGALVYGMLIWAGRDDSLKPPSPRERMEGLAVNIARTLQRTRLCMAAGRNNGAALATGANYALAFDSDGHLAYALGKIKSGIFLGEDLATRDAVLGAGGLARNDNRLATAVLTRGGRMPFRALFGNVKARQAARDASYREQYGDSIGAYEVPILGTQTTGARPRYSRSRIINILTRGRNSC